MASCQSDLYNRLQTRSRIPIWRQFVQKLEVLISELWIKISYRNLALQIDLDLLKQVPSLNPNTEVDLRRHGRHLEKSMWRQNSAVRCLIWIKLDRPMQNDMSMTINSSKLTGKWNFNMPNICFQKKEVVIFQPGTEMCDRNLVYKPIWTFLNECRQ